MNLFIICFSLAMIIYVLTLPYVGKRKKGEPTRVYSEHFPWEEKRIAYNRMHSLPDDAI